MGDLLSSRWAPGGAGSTSKYHQSTYSYPSSLQSKPGLSPTRAATTTPTSHNQNFHGHTSTARSRGPSPNPNPNTPSRRHGTALPPHEELARFMKIVSRLRWKLPFLAEAYRLATIPVQHSESSGSMLDESGSDAAAAAAEVAHAEIMFKIDFHEYYALLERAIVHLLAIFNISVSSRSRGQVQLSGSGSANGSSYNNNGPAIHRYHANVLHALEEETTPLTPVLGSGKTIEYLYQAKRLRNRWKTADMTDDEKERDPIGDRAGESALPLSSYNFEEIIMGIFAGLEEAYLRARSHVEMCRRPEDVSGSANGNGVGSEEDWEFMVDAMDWEAV